MDGLTEGRSRSMTPMSDLPRAFSSSFWNFECLGQPAYERPNPAGPNDVAVTPANSSSLLTISHDLVPSVSSPSSARHHGTSAAADNVLPEELTSLPGAQGAQSFAPWLARNDAPSEAADIRSIVAQATDFSPFGDGVQPVADDPIPEEVLRSDAFMEVEDPEDAAHASDSTHAQDEPVMNLSSSEDVSEGGDFWGEGKEDSEALRYDFRLAPRVRPLTGGATWLDQDQSGDYDPSKKAPRFSTRLVRRRKRDEVDNEGDNHEGDNQEGEEDRTVTKRVRNYYYARRAGLRLIIRLIPNTEEGKARLKQYADSVPPEYDENKSWNFLLDDDDEQSTEESSDDFAKPRRLRNHPREAHGKSRKCFTRDRSQSIPEQLIGLGHPAARGCKACHSLGQDCSMLEPDGTYPCLLCIEDDCDCELLVEPLKKRSCERCRKRRVRCSYVDTDDHSGPCEGCQDAGIRCVAGPAIDTHRTRIGHDGKPATIHEKEPQYRRPLHAQRAATSNDLHRPQSHGRYFMCINCKEDGKHCNIRRSKIDLPCRSCTRSGAECILHDRTVGAPSPAWHKARPAQLSTAGDQQTMVKDALGQLDDEAAQHFKRLAADAQDSSRSQSPLPFPSAQPRAPGFGSGLVGGLLTPKTPAQFLIETFPVDGKVTTIRTRLLHPLKFNAPTCNWCEDPIFGILGIGAEVNVKVRLWPGGKGCTELSRSASQSSSNMCPNCTMERVLALTCDGHRLRRICGIRKELTDITAVLETLEMSNPGYERKRAEARLCSICPAVAAFECCTKPEAGTPGETADSGCGLRFCDTCACLFEELYARDLNAMVTQINGADVESYPEGLRADYGFFAQNSFLVKQVLDD